MKHSFGTAPKNAPNNVCVCSRTRTGGQGWLLLDAPDACKTEPQTSLLWNTSFPKQWSGGISESQHEYTVNHDSRIRQSNMASRKLATSIFSFRSVSKRLTNDLVAAGGSLCWRDRKSTRLNSSHANISY